MIECPYCKQERSCLKLSQDLPAICPRCLVNTGLLQMTLDELRKFDEDLEVLLDAREKGARQKEARETAVRLERELEAGVKDLAAQEKKQRQLREEIDDLRNTIESLESKMRQADLRLAERFKSFPSFFLMDNERKQH